MDHPVWMNKKGGRERVSDVKLFPREIMKWFAVVALALPALVSATVPGIDVSHWQGDINWGAVKANGVQWAYIKATESTSMCWPVHVCTGQRLTTPITQPTRTLSSAPITCKSFSPFSIVTLLTRIVVVRLMQVSFVEHIILLAPTNLVALLKPTTLLLMAVAGVPMVSPFLVPSILKVHIFGQISYATRT